MSYVEQAVFTSAETDRSAGYQVVGSSPGVCSADARELVVWGPSHDSLLELGPEAVSLNFHPLPSGCYCVSRTTAAGWEYSGRGGHRVYTQCLIVPPNVLWRFANDPFAVSRAAEAGGMWAVYDQVPQELQPLALAGGAAPVDQNLLARLATNPGPTQMAVLVQQALDTVCLAVVGPSAGQLIAGLLSCLPPQCRTEFSFATGLKFSSRRPFRIIAVARDPAQQRWVANQGNVTVLDVADGASGATAPMDGWARLIERVLATGRTSFLAAQLSGQTSHLAAEDLPALGLQLLEDLEASDLQTECGREHGHGARGSTLTQRSGADNQQPPAHEAGGRPVFHAAHRRFQKSRDAASDAGPQAAAATALEAESPQVLQKLEYLDDLVFEAIRGETTALEELKGFWPDLLHELGEQLLAESRQQYLRYALQIWETAVQPDGLRNPSRAMQALDVLCVLFNESL
jgi:hypothetical protein